MLTLLVLDQISDWLLSHVGEVIAGIVGGAVVAFLTGIFRYIRGRQRAGRSEDASFHIAATLYTPIDLARPEHAHYREAVAQGKTHVQELLWLGEEVALATFLPNPFVLSEVSNAMDRSKREGLLLGDLHEDAERPLLKKILGYHNTIPMTDLVHLYKNNVGRTADGRVFGISPPTCEDYPGSPHRRVLRAMFIADSQLAYGIPPRDSVLFINDGQQNRHATLTTLIQLYRDNPDAFARCRAYFRLPDLSSDLARPAAFC